MKHTQRSHRSRIRWGTWTLALSSTLLLTSCQLMSDDTGSDTKGVVGISSVDNPALEKRCGIDVVLVMDASSSVRNFDEEVDDNGAVDLVVGAANAFLQGFSRTNTRIAVVSYNADPIAQLGLVDVSDESLAPGGAHAVAMGDPGGELGPIPETTGYSEHARRGSGTNWEAGLRTAQEILADARPGVPQLIVHITDGRPTRHLDENGDVTDEGGKAVHVAEAAEAADELKAAGIHIYAVGIGRAGSGGSYLEELQAVSGPDFYDQGDPEDVFDAANDDVILTADFAALEEALAGLANALCAASLTITKVASTIEAPTEYNPVEGIPFTASPSASGGYDWLLPESGNDTSQTAATDAGGRVQFQWDIFNDSRWGNGTVTVTEAAQEGYQMLAQVECVRANDNVAFQVSADVATGTFNVPLAPGDITTCAVTNVPAAVADPPIFHICTDLRSMDPDSTEAKVPMAGGEMRFNVLMFSGDDEVLYLESIHDSILGDLLDDNNPLRGDGYCRGRLDPGGSTGCAWTVTMEGGEPGTSRVHETTVVFATAEGVTSSQMFETLVEVASE